MTSMFLIGRRKESSIRLAGRVGIILLAIAVPLFLITTNLRIIINSGWLYSYGFNKYDIPAYTGIEQPELMRVAREIKGYFNNSEEFLDVNAVIYGVQAPLFNQREIAHMKDVKGLVKGLAFWQRVTFLYMVGLAVAGLLALGRRRVIPILATGLFWGCALTVALLAAVGIGSLVGFDALFTQFHLISFSNDFWLLDPRTDNLVRIFPQGFFLDATLMVAGLTLAPAVLIGTLAGGYLWRTRLQEGQ